jgi:hypothetical protein
MVFAATRKFSRSRIANDSWAVIRTGILTIAFGFSSQYYGALALAEAGTQWPRINVINVFAIQTNFASPSFRAPNAQFE